MSKKRKYDGLEVRVPLTEDVDGPIVFQFQMTEAEVRDLSRGITPARVQDTCQGMLDWLAGDTAPESVPVGSSVGSRELFK